METRKVTVTATRYYSKQTTVEIDVPVDMTPWYTGSVFPYPSASLPPV